MNFGSAQFTFQVVACAIVIAFPNLVLGNFNKLQYVVEEPNDTVLLDRWKSLETKVRDGVGSIIKQVFPMIVRSSSEVDLTPECTGAILKTVRGIQNIDQWAILMLDATGKPGDGIMTGSITSFGSYDQCLEVEVPDDRGGVRFTGQYCTVEMRFPLPKKPDHFYRMMELIKPFDRYKTTNKVLNETIRYAPYLYSIAFRFGVCTPSDCTKDDIQQIASNIAKMADLNAHVRGCEVLEKGFNPDGTQIALLCIFVLFGVTVLTATIVDYLPEILDKLPSPEGKEPEKGFPMKLFGAFSVRANMKKLLRDEDGDSSLPALHGYRFLAMTWVILGHTYLYIDWTLWQHFAKAMDIVRTIPFQVITNASPCVDSFFFLSGFLVCYTTVTYVDKKGVKVFNIPLILFRRIYRLVPSMMLIVALMILMPLIGSGPLWKENIGAEANNCRKNWWVPMLFGNNIIFPTEMCLAHLWYVSADMHLFICSMFFLYLLFKQPKFATTFNVIFICAGLIATAIITYTKRLPPVPLAVNPDYYQRITLAYYTYFATHSHTPSYGIGLALGHMIARHPEWFKMKRSTKLVGWILATICNLTVLYSANVWLHDKAPTIVESIAYASLYRVGWCLGLSWLVAACVTGQGGIINEILSWKAFVPLSRVTFMTYLVHLLVIQAFYGSMRTGFETGNLMCSWFFFAFVLVSFGLAIICRMLFEAPILEVEKLVMARIFGDKAVKDSNEGVNGDAKMAAVNGDAKKRNGNSFNIEMVENSDNKHRDMASRNEVILNRMKRKDID